MNLINCTQNKTNRILSVSLTSVECIENTIPPTIIIRHLSRLTDSGTEYTGCNVWRLMTYPYSEIGIVYQLYIVLDDRAEGSWFVSSCLFSRVS